MIRRWKQHVETIRRYIYDHEYQFCYEEMQKVVRLSKIIIGKKAAGK